MGQTQTCTDTCTPSVPFSLFVTFRCGGGTLIAFSKFPVIVRTKQKANKKKKKKEKRSTYLDTFLLRLTGQGTEFHFFCETWNRKKKKNMSNNIICCFHTWFSTPWFCWSKPLTTDSLMIFFLIKDILFKAAAEETLNCAGLWHHRFVKCIHPITSPQFSLCILLI